MHAQVVFPSRLLYLAEKSFGIFTAKTTSFQQTNLTTKCRTSAKENNSSLENRIFSRAFHGDDSRTSADVQSRNRQRLVALFKRIQRSISESESNNQSNANISQVPSDYVADSHRETSVLQFLQLSTHGTNNMRSNVKQNEEMKRNRRTILPKKETQQPIQQPQSNTRPSRLRSNFVKRSPIPSPTPLRSINLEMTNKEMQRSESNKRLPQIEGMKLSELKQLAKDKGIKGYSKLKKGEIIELLISHVNG